MYAHRERTIPIAARTRGSALSPSSLACARTGWDREFVDATNDKNDKYDRGAPDYQSGEKKNLKWRIICAGVERLIQEKGLRAEDVLLWCDWQVGATGRHMRPTLSPGATHTRARFPRPLAHSPFTRTTRRRSSRAS